MIIVTIVITTDETTSRFPNRFSHRSTCERPNQATDESPYNTSTGDRDPRSGQDTACNATTKTTTNLTGSLKNSTTLSRMRLLCGDTTIPIIVVSVHNIKCAFRHIVRRAH
jgi:hypothetical protein